MLRGSAATAYRMVSEILQLNKNFFPRAIFPKTIEKLQQPDFVKVAEKRGEFNVYEA